MASIHEVPVEAETINILHSLDATKILEGGPSSLIDAGEFFKSPDTMTMKALNERVANRRGFFQERGNAVLQKPDRIEYRRPSTLHPVNSMHHQEGFVFIGKQGDTVVEVTLPHHNLTKLTEAAGRIDPALLEATTTTNIYADALVIEVPVTDEIMKIIAERDAEPEEIRKLRSQSNPSEGGSSLQWGQIQQYEERSRKDHGSMSVQVLWDADHHESMDITDVTSPDTDFYKTPVVRTRFTQLRWGASVAHRNPKNDHAPVTSVFVTTQNEKMPQIEISEEHGDLSIANGQKTTQHGVETITFPYDSHGGVLHRESFDRYYPQGGTPSGWVSESGFVGHIAADKKGWNIVHAHRFDYQKGVVDAQGTGSRNYMDRSNPVNKALLKDHLGLAQAGIEQGGKKMRDISKASKMALSSIPQ